MMGPGSLDRWTAGSLVLVAALVCGAPAGARQHQMPARAELVNVLVSPEYSRWLIGPIWFMATPAERAEFLEIADDQRAATFIEEFWKRRDPEPEIFGNPVRALFEERAEEADRRFRERARLGRSTDRGTIWILYGEPERIEFDTSLDPREPDLEVWTYPKDAPPGLDGEKPARRYWFAGKDGEIVLHTPRAGRRSTIRQ